MPRKRAAAKPAEPVAEPEVKDPEPVEERTSGPVEPRTEEPVECPHGLVEGCPFCATPAEPAPAAEPEAEEAPEPEVAPVPRLLTDEEWDEFIANAPSEVDLPLDEGEEITGQRTDDDGDLFVVTSFGRKLGISPDGFITVLMGPPLEVEAASVPKPPRKSWKDPR